MVSRRTTHPRGRIRQTGHRVRNANQIRGRPVHPGMTEREETGVELLMSEPEIVAWLEPDDPGDEGDEAHALE